MDGSVNVNRTHEELEDGVDVECVDDYDTFTAPFPVDSLEELIRFVDEDDEVIEDDDEDEFNDEDDE